MRKAVQSEIGWWVGVGLVEGDKRELQGEIEKDIERERDPVVKTWLKK